MSLPPKPLDIFLARILWRHSKDLRPVVILNEGRAGVVVVALISASDLFNRTTDFPLRKDQPGFTATGLTRNSFISGTEIRELEITRLERRLGCLEGDLARAFRNWMGI